MVDWRLLARLLTGSLQTVHEWFKSDPVTFGVKGVGGSRTEMKCFCCNTELETTSHFLTGCQACEMVESRQTSYKKQEQVLHYKKDTLVN